jgi:membrane protein DedA with SNARE-associated domain
MSATRIAAACAAIALVALATHRIRTGRGGRAALGLLAATLLILYAADATAALPDGEGAVEDAGDALGAWTYPFMGAMAFLETSIPPVTLVFPGEWAVMLGGAMAGEGQIAIVPLIALVWVCSAAGDSVTFGLGRRLGRPFLLARGGRIGVTEPRLAKLDAWLDRYGSTAVCLGRLVPLARPFGPLVAGASRFPYRRFLPWSLAGTLLFSLVFCGLGYVFYRSYDDVAASLSRSAFAFVLLIGAAVSAYVVLQRRRRKVAP